MKEWTYFFYNISMRLLFKKLMILVIFTITLPGCEDRSPIKIGFVSSLSGRFSQMGTTGRNAVKLKIDEVNAAGGIRNRKILFFPADNKGETQLTHTAVSKLIERNVSFIVGPLLSNMAKPALKAIKDKKVLIVSPTVTTDSISGIDDNFLRITAASSKQSVIMMGLLNPENYSTGALYYDIRNKEYTQPIISDLLIRFEKSNIKLVYSNDMSDNTESLSHRAMELNKSGAQFVILICSGIDGALFCQELAKNKADIVKYGTSWLKTNKFLDHGGKTVEGIKIVSIRENNSPQFEAFKARYYNTYYENPDLVARFNYEAISVLLEAMKISKEITPEAVKQTILNIKRFDIFDDPIELDAYGDTNRSLGTFIVKDGKFIEF